ncbi:MAG: hypothetical protein SPH68_01455 [Candidatus Borkfalkiaceae bacterium]|nr:hypothetical protein [Clostridia bacterium]MDY6222811.1 hypothetical protein [Christensenellaceae bacterium]
MSKNYPEKEVDVDALTQEELEAIANDEAETPAPKKRVFSRILTVLLALAPIALMCFLPVSLFLYSGKYVFNNEVTLLKVFMNVFKQNGVAEVYAAAGLSAPANVGSYAFHGIPLLNAAGNYGKAFSWFIYAFPAVFLLNIVFMIVGVCSGKHAPAMVRAISFTDMLLFGGYAILTLFLSSVFGGGKLVYDVVVLSCAGAGVLFFAAYTVGKRKGKITLPLVLLILTLAFVGSYVFAIFKYDLRAQLLAWYNVDDVIAGAFTWGKALMYVVRGVTVLYALAILISVIRLSSKKGYGFDIFRYCLHLVLALIILYPCFFDMPFTKSFNEKEAFADLKWFAVAAAGVALIQTVICIIAKKVIKAKEAAYLDEEDDEETEEAEETQAEEADDGKAAESTTEAVAEEKVAPEEAVPAQTPAAAWITSAQVNEAAPAPAEIEEEEQLVIPNFSSFRDDGEELEETPAPTIIPVASAANTNDTARTTATPYANAAATPAPSATASYDYYNTRSFDPFIASLNEKEREQFTDLFILKYQGVMKNLPDYVVGGDNDEFFRKVFIYLGQYRERIPDNLLAKMYKFCIKR